jgi:copper chaperone CopZ
MDKGFLFSRKMWAVVMVLLVVLMAAAALALQYGGEGTAPPLTVDRNDPVKGGGSKQGVSKAVLKVSNMSCSGCISTIKGSLAGFKDIEDIVVDLASGRVAVFYGPESGADVTQMAQAITESGYPAKILKVFSPEEMQKERALAASKSKHTVASVSGYDIARADFDMEMAAALKKYRADYGDGLFNTAQGKSLEQRLQRQILSNLIDQVILLQEIKRSGYSLDEGTFKAELEAYMKKSGMSEQQLQQTVRDAGYDYDYFTRRFRTGVLINRFVDEKVLAGTKTPGEKQRAFAAWSGNARARADIAYYDKNLERVARQQGTSGSCCAVN